MKLHQIKAQVQEITGLTVSEENEGVSVFVTGETPALVSKVSARLSASGLKFIQSKHRKFKGAKFTLLLRNVGTAFAANWEFAQ